MYDYGTRICRVRFDMEIDRFHIDFTPSFSLFSLFRFSPFAPVPSRGIAELIVAGNEELSLGRSLRKMENYSRYR